MEKKIEEMTSDELVEQIKKDLAEIRQMNEATLQILKEVIAQYE